VDIVDKPDPESRLFGLRKLRDVGAGVLERDELAAPPGSVIGSANALFQLFTLKP
jgi:hypothetical protein